MIPEFIQRDPNARELREVIENAFPDSHAFGRKVKNKQTAIYKVFVNKEAVLPAVCRIAEENGYERIK